MQKAQYNFPHVIDAVPQLLPLPPFINLNVQKNYSTVDDQKQSIVIKIARDAFSVRNVVDMHVIRLLIRK